MARVLSALLKPSIGRRRSGVSAALEHYRNDFDLLCIAEAEHVWPQFIMEWEAGS
jgi:hypothetical protein